MQNTFISQRPRKPALLPALGSLICNLSSADYHLGRSPMVVPTSQHSKSSPLDPTSTVAYPSSPSALQPRRSCVTLAAHAFARPYYGLSVTGQPHDLSPRDSLLPVSRKNVHNGGVVRKGIHERILELWSHSTGAG